jgi:hypothetical protein
MTEEDWETLFLCISFIICVIIVFWVGYYAGIEEYKCMKF